MKIETAKSILSTAASLAATAVVIRSIVNDLLPQEFPDYLYSSLRAILFRRTSSDITTIIEEFDGLENNKIFEAAELYIGARAKAMSSSNTSTRLKVRKPESQKQILVNVDNNEEIVEAFEGIKFRWLLHCQHVETHDFYNPRDKNATLKSEVRAFHLTFHKKFKDIAIQKYLLHILNEAELLKQENRTIKLYTIDPNSLYGSPADAWSSISLNHPATFETLALDAGLKKMIIEDIERFLRRKEYYGHVGKVWKRGYLLYGPPGTGKSTLIAALANYLNFDIYDLQLGGLSHDWELRKALVGTTNKSIVVVEDIDCSIEFKDRENDDNGDANALSTGVRENKVTLSGLLNFIDGLWSSCGDERIIIFTTNHKDKLDPALLRPGRMDMHIHMSFCNPGGFRVLAMNYLGLKDHELFIEIDKLIEEVEVTPAEIAEQLMRHEEPDLALTGLIDFLKSKKVAETIKVEEAKKLEDEPKSEGKVDDTLGKDAQDANETKLAR